MRVSHYLAILIVTPILMLPLPALFNYYCDPYQIYHLSRFPEAGLANNQRYQNAGLVNTWLADPEQDYDAILIGTSLSANFTEADTQKYLLWDKPLRLFMDGGRPLEQALLVKHALTTKRVKKILWELHPVMYAGTEPSGAIDPSIFPLYLYNSSVADDFPYLFNQDVLKLSWKLFSGNVSDFNQTPQYLGSWDQYHDWIQKQRAAFNQPERIRELLQFPSLQLSQDPGITQRLVYPVLTSELFPVIDSLCNSDVDVVFFIAPVSKALHLGNITYSTRTLYLPRFILQRTTPCKNISLYAFDTEDFSNDFSNYKDREHYLPEINSQILAMIGRGQDRLTLDNVDHYESRLRDILNTKAIVSSYHQ